MRLLTLTLLSCVALAGCGRESVPTMDLKISRGDWPEYTRSLDDITKRLTREERSEWANCLQELKFQAMLTQNLSPGPGLNAAIREKIAGMSAREVLAAGYTFKLSRKQDEEKALRHSIAMNRRLRTRPGDEASATFLQSTHVNQAGQWEILRKEITGIQQRLNELDPSLSKSWPSFAPLDEAEVVAADELDEKPVLERKQRTPGSQPF